MSSPIEHALHLDVSPMLLHDAVTDGEPQAIPFPTSLVVKNGFEDAA